MTVPTLTFIHGFMGDPSDWDFVRAELSEYKSTAPLIKPARDWDSGVEQLMEELPRRSILVGYSMGARLALAVALSRPEVCAGLVFVSGNPGIEDDEARRKRYESDCRIADEIESVPRQDFLHQWYTQSTVFKSLTADVRADEIARKAAYAGDDWSAILRTYSVAMQPNYWPRLCELKMPVMAIAGMSDRKYANMIVKMDSANISTRVVASCCRFASFGV